MSMDWQSFSLCSPAGLKEARKQHNETAKLSLHFRADESGIITLEKGEATSEVSEEYTVKVPLVPEGLSPELSKALENITWPESFGQKNATEKVRQLISAVYQSDIDQLGKLPINKVASFLQRELEQKSIEYRYC